MFRLGSLHHPTVRGNVAGRFSMRHFGTLSSIAVAMDSLIMQVKLRGVAVEAGEPRSRTERHADWN